MDWLKKQVILLQKENTGLHKLCREHERYKRRWSLRLNGVPEREGDNVREDVIKILSEVVPLTAENLHSTVHSAQAGSDDESRSTQADYYTVLHESGPRSGVEVVKECQILQREEDPL